MVRPPAETQAGIARKCGVTVQAVGKWVSGVTRPGAKHRKKLAKLGISIESWEQQEAPAVETEEKGAA